MKGSAVGLALGAGRGVAAWWPGSSGTPASARTAAFVFDADALAAGDDSTLLDGLRAARQGSTGDSLHVALASPWTSPREVELPPMRESEAQRVLTRDAARYFPTRRAEPAVATRVLRPGVWLAFDADGVVLDAIARAARIAGFASVRIVAAVAAWADSAGDAREASFALEGESAILAVKSGGITALRRTRAADHSGGAASAGDALALAARHAPQASDRELLSRAQQRVREAAAARRSQQWMIIGAAVAIAAALLLVWWSGYRVSQIESQRAALRPTVAPFLALRDSLLDVQDARDALARGSDQAPWSERLLALAQSLPDDAVLTAFRAAGDSVIVEGSATDAQATIERFSAARGVRRVVTSSSAGVSDDDRERFAAIVFFGERAPR